MRAATAPRLAAAAVVVVLLAGLAFSAGRQGLSDLYVQSARQQVERWARAKQGVSGSQWVQAMGYLDRSLALAPRNAWTLEELASLHLRRVRVATQPDASAAAARAGYIRLRKALLERPSSPYAWASLAYAKLLLGEADAELFTALDRAARLGPWEAEVLHTVIFVGLAAWPHASAPQRATITAAVDRGILRSPGRVVEIARGFDRLDLICAKSTAEIVAAACAPRRNKKS